MTMTMTIARSGVIILTMNEEQKENFKSQYDSRFTMRELTSKPNTWRIWIPKKYKGDIRILP